MSSVIVLDAGNSIIKFKRSDGREFEFPHALKEMSESDYKVIASKNSGKMPEGYIRVNDKPYAYGRQAERYGVMLSRDRAARYTKDYYGVITAIALALAYEKGGSYSLFGSHAPGDSIHREKLMRAAAGTWEVEIEGKKRTYKITYANTFDEPQGGLMNVILTEDGTHYRHSEINGGRALVIDIGGRTTDWLAVHPGGEVDYSLAESVGIGIIDVIETFDRAFKDAHPDLVQDLPNLPMERIQKALQADPPVISLKGREYPCEFELNEAANLVLNRIADAYRTKARSGADYDSIILTGGGAALLYDRLLSILDHGHVMLAEEAPKIHMANVRGGLKLWRLYEAEGLLEDDE